MNKAIKFVNEFLKNFSIISAGALFIHVVVTFFDLYLYNSHYIFSFDALFYSYKVPVIVSYGVLTLMLYSLYRKLQDTRKELKKEKKINEEREDKFSQLSEISAYILQTISENNNNLKSWVEIRRASGSVPERVEAAVAKIGNSLDLFSRAFFLVPYIAEPVKVVADEQIRRLQR